MKDIDFESIGKKLKEIGIENAKNKLNEQYN